MKVFKFIVGLLILFICLIFSVSGIINEILNFSRFFENQNELIHHLEDLFGVLILLFLSYLGIRYGIRLMRPLIISFQSDETDAVIDEHL